MLNKCLFNAHKKRVDFSLPQRWYRYFVLEEYQIGINKSTYENGFALARSAVPSSTVRRAAAQYRAGFIYTMGLPHYEIQMAH
jgi:hypothetical protein